MSRTFQLPPSSTRLASDGVMSLEWYRYFEEAHSWGGHRGSAFDIWDLDVAGHGGWGAGTTGTYSPQAGINLRAFDAALDEYVERSSGLMNGYTSGTDLYPAVLWVPSDATAGNVKWRFGYSRVAKTGTLAGVTYIDATTAASGVKDKAVLSVFSKIDGKTFRAGDSIIQVLERAGSDADDTYAADVGLLWAGYAFQRSGHGTKERTP